MAGSKLQRRRGLGARVRFNDLFKLPRIPALIGCRHASAVSCARQGLAWLPDRRGGAGAGGRWRGAEAWASARKGKV